MNGPSIDINKNNTHKTANAVPIIIPPNKLPTKKEGKIQANQNIAL